MGILHYNGYYKLSKLDLQDKFKEQVFRRTLDKIYAKITQDFNKKKDNEDDS